MYVSVMMGVMAVLCEDYLEIVSLQHGFDSYNDMLYNGFVVDLEDEIAKIKHRPQSINTSKTVLSMHRQGLEPWTP